MAGTMKRRAERLVNDRALCPEDRATETTSAKDGMHEGVIRRSASVMA
jgi:hypothetical protein